MAAFITLSCSISSSSTWSRPAVSMNTISLPCFLACSMPALAMSTGSIWPIWNTGTSTCWPTTSNWVMAAGRKVSQATRRGRLPCFFIKPASLAPLVVLPAPLRPTSITTVGGLGEIVSLVFSPPIRAVSSSLTILTIIWAGVRLSSTSEPMARSVTVATNCLTTLKFTSASSRAMRISFMASFTSASERRPLPRSFLKAAESFSVSPSNAMGYSCFNWARTPLSCPHRASSSSSCQWASLRWAMASTALSI